MSVEFKPAVRQSISLLLGFAGGTGSGKTFSALRVATGLAGGSPFGVIDTENGRALHYADDFAFEHASLEPPFTPARYLEAIAAADAKGFPVIVVDSASHEHAGTGGLLDMHDAELERRGGGDNQNMAAWILPKREHGRYRDALLAMRAHVVLCFRAEPKVEVKRIDGKTQIVPKETLTGLDGWVPISEKNLPFEMTASFLLMADAPGVPRPIKLEERLRSFVPLDEPLTEATGVALGEWARGSDLPPARTSSAPTADAPPPAGEFFASVKELGVSLETLWTEIAAVRNIDRDEMLELLHGANPDGSLRWKELKDSIEASERSAILARLRAVPA